MVTFTHDQPSTPETHWLQSPGIAGMPTLNIVWEEISRLIVVAAHPDDETLGAAGLLQQASQNGVPIEIIVATWGEKSHPSSPTHSASDLKQLRALELQKALEILVPGSRHRALGLTDGELAEHAAALEAEIMAAARDDATALIVAPWASDGHTDHDAAGAAAARAAHATGSKFLEYPIWMWHWADPGTEGAQRGIIPWPALRRLELKTEEQTKKAAAVNSHATQVAALSPSLGDEALLSSQMLEHFQRSFETFIDVAGHFTPIGSAEDEWLEQQFDAAHAGGIEPWAPESWYERRKRGMLLAGLDRPQFQSGLELGCSTGALLEDLAPRCNQLLGIDASMEALDSAKRRTTHLRTVSFHHGILPRDWPPGFFDLIIMSEIGYYMSRTALVRLLDRITGSAMKDALFVACHWRHPIDGWPLDGADVHQLLRAEASLVLIGSYLENDFQLDFFRFRDRP